MCNYSKIKQFVLLTKTFLTIYELLECNCGGDMEVDRRK